MANGHIPHLTEWIIMHDGNLNQETAEKKPLRTLEEFVAAATAFNARHSKTPGVFAKHMTHWTQSGCNPAELALNIRGTLEFQRNELAKRTYRSDHSKEQLVQIIADIKNHVVADYADHLAEVVVAIELVEWCDAYIELTPAQSTT